MIPPALSTLVPRDARLQQDLFMIAPANSQILWHKTLELKAKCAFLPSSGTFQLAPTQCKRRGHCLSWKEKSGKCEDAACNSTEKWARSCRGKYGSHEGGCRKYKYLEFRKIPKSQDAGKDIYRGGIRGKPNYFHQKVWVKREKIAGNQRALIKLNSLRFYMMQWDTQWKIPMSHLVFVMGCKQS